MSHITEEQLGWVEEATHRAVRKALKRYSLGASIAFLVLFAGLAIAGKTYVDRLHNGLVGSCNRVNVLRAQSNLSDTVSFNILSISGQREKALVKLDKEAAAQHRKSSNALFKEARKLTITKVTNCEEAVDSPDHYVTPIAGPIGNPATGKLDPGVARVIRDSEDLLRRERTTNDLLP